MSDGGGRIRKEVIPEEQDKSGAWKVYDVVIENVSLVMNYRSQFNDILAEGTHDELLEILRKKSKGQKS